MTLRSKVSSLVGHSPASSRRSCSTRQLGSKNCTPCRIGARRVEEIFGCIVNSGAAPTANFSEFERLVTALKWTSLCGHGGGLGEFAESILRYYRYDLATCFK